MYSLEVTWCSGGFSFTKQCFWLAFWTGRGLCQVDVVFGATWVSLRYFYTPTDSVKDKSE